MNIKNDLLLRALRGEDVERVPVWMMRQAGRYLPEYIKIREKYSFFERCQNPELATEITLQPIDIIGVDAAILFSDILVVPQAMGLEVQLIESKGPYLPNPIKNQSDLKRLSIPNVEEKLGYVVEAIKLIKKSLNNRVPLIGFAGSPWTLLCYMVQGQGSKTFDEAKAFCYTQPILAHQLLAMITETTIAYLKAQIEAGADTVQIFDSWGGLLGVEDFNELSLQYLQKIVQAISPLAPVIVFSKGAWFALPALSKIGAAGLGIDWNTPPKLARDFVGNKICLQGNFDPAKLLSPIPTIIKETEIMIRSFGKKNYIANLGHGILPNVPVENAKAFVRTVQNFDYSTI